MFSENDILSVESKDESGCLISLHIHLKPAATQKAYKNAIKRINKEISIPGFRKGKAPDTTIEANYKPHIEKEWKELVIESAYSEAVKLIQIYPISQKAIQRPKLEKCSLEEGADVLISYEHFPVFPSLDFSTISLPPLTKEEVKASEVEDILSAIQRDNATYEEISGRGIEKGDFAIVSLERVEEDKTLPLITERRIEVDEKKIAPWLSALLLHLEKGQSREGTPETADEKEKAYLPKKVKVTCHEIQKIILPTVDDELAKKIGFQSLDLLRTDIQTNLEKQKEEELKKRKYGELERALLKAFPFELPSSIVKDVTERNLKGRTEALKRMNLPQEEFDKKRKEMEEQVTKEVLDLLRLRFLFDEIAHTAKINVSNSELNQAVEKEVAANPLYFGDMKDQNLLRQKIEQLSRYLLEEKILAYLLAQVEAGRA